MSNLYGNKRVKSESRQEPVAVPPRLAGWRPRACRGPCSLPDAAQGAHLRPGSHDARPRLHPRDPAAAPPTAQLGSGDTAGTQPVAQRRLGRPRRGGSGPKGSREARGRLTLARAGHAPSGSALRSAEEPRPESQYALAQWPARRRAAHRRGSPWQPPWPPLA